MQEEDGEGNTRLAGQMHEAESREHEIQELQGCDDLDVNFQRLIMN